MFDEDFDDVLGDYLHSLRRLLDVPIGLTYPAHGTLIERGAARVEQILLHHDRRLGQMADRARQHPQTAWEMVGGIFRPHLSPVQQRLALRETVAHLEYLRVREVLAAHDRDGVLWYESSPRQRDAL